MALLFSSFLPMRINMREFPLFKHREEYNSHDELIIRRMMIQKELPIIYRWLNLHYSERFWQMSGVTMEQLCAKFEERGEASHFVITVNKAVIAYFELYIPFSDELALHYEFDLRDVGFHFLLGPGKEVIESLPNQIFNLTRNLLVFIIHYTFKYSDARVIYVEPDVNNTAAVKLAMNVGFESIGVINLSYKSANLFAFSKSKFYKSYKCFL